MGLAASQARLLSLTSRQHNIEHKAQYLQAQKLRLANDSDAAYEKYITALDATQIKTRLYNSQGKAGWADASVNNLMRLGLAEGTTGNTYFVQDVDSKKLYVPQKIYDAYYSSSDLDSFLNKLGATFEMVDSDEYISAKLNYDNDIESNYNNSNYVKIYSEYFAIKNNLDTTETYNLANNISNLLVKNGLGAYYQTSTDDYANLKSYLKTLKNTNYYKNNSSNKKLINTALTDFSTSDLISNSDSVQSMTFDKKINGKATTYLLYTQNSTVKLNEFIENNKYALFLNGGTAEKKFNTNTTESYLVYSEDMQDSVNSYNNDYSNSSMGDALLQLADSIKESETSSYATSYCTKNNTDEATIVENYQNYQKYLEDKETYERAVENNKQSYSFNDSQSVGENYIEIYTAISKSEGCEVLNEQYCKSSSWVTNMVKNAKVVLATYDKDEDTLVLTSSSSDGGLQEVSNEADVETADVEYETTLNDITEKENKYDVQLKKLESERTAIKTEIDQLKTVADDNINKTFNLFS